MPYRKVLIRSSNGVVQYRRVSPETLRKKYKRRLETIEKGAHKGRHYVYEPVKPPKPRARLLYYVYLGYHGEKVTNNSKPRDFDVAFALPRKPQTREQVVNAALDRLFYCLANRYGTNIETDISEYAESMNFLQIFHIGVEKVPIRLPEDLFIVNDYERVYPPYFWMFFDGQMRQVGTEHTKMPEWYYRLIDYRERLVTLDLDDVDFMVAASEQAKLEEALIHLGYKFNSQLTKSTHEGHYHVRVELDRPLPWSQHFELREMCGDDPNRIAHDQMRIEFYKGQGEVLFEKKLFEVSENEK